MTTPKSLSQKDSFLTSLDLLIDTWPKRGNSNGKDSKTRNDGYTLNTIPALYLPKELCCEGMWTKKETVVEMVEYEIFGKTKSIGRVPAW